MRTRFRFSIAELIPIAVALLASFPLHNNDLWWHLATGRWIWMHHAVPRDDIFSWTHYLGAWVDNEWLSELFLYGVWNIFGPTALIVARALIFTGLALLLRTWMRVMRQPRLFLPAIAGAVIVSHHWWEIRPSVATLAALLIMMIVIERARLGVDRLWTIPILFLVWANTHPGFFFGLVILVCITVACLLDPLLPGWKRSTRGALRASRMAIVTAAAAVATLINPYGLRVYEQQFAIARNPLYRRLLDEWMSPPLWIAAIAVAAILVALIRVKRIPLSRLAPLFGSALLSLTAIRFCEYLGWVAIPLALTVLPRLRLPASRATAAAHLGVAALVSLLFLLPNDRIEPMRYPCGCDAQITPRDRLFNRLSWGGWLIWRRNLATFIDGRCSGQRLFFGYALAENGQALQRFDQWRIDTVLVSRTEGVSRQLLAAPSWKLVCDDGTALLFRRNGIPGPPASLTPVRRR